MAACGSGVERNGLKRPVRVAASPQRWHARREASEQGEPEQRAALPGGRNRECRR
jgi:hypothetical protein